MRGARVKALRKQYREEHGRPPGTYRGEHGAINEFRIYKRAQKRMSHANFSEEKEHGKG